MYLEHCIDARHLIADRLFFISLRAEYHRVGDTLESRGYRADDIRSYGLDVGVDTAYDQGNRTTTSLSPLRTTSELVWIYLLTPKNEPDFTEDLDN